jgi:hypothetical protein
MNYAPNPDRDAWIKRANEGNILETAQRLGAQLKRSGSGEFVGPCPQCGGDDRFQVQSKEGVFLCRGSACGKNGSDGGNIITMVMHMTGCTFLEACEEITGEPPPGAEKGEPKPLDESARQESRDAGKDRMLIQLSEEERIFEDKCEQAVDLFDNGADIAGTHAMAYLNLRGLFPSPTNVTDLRFVPDMPYWGLASPDDHESSALGEFPCLIAAIRDRNMRIIGCHRIYLDPKKPIKITPPGDPRRNAAKKAFGNVKGGAIWLGPVTPGIAIAEGIETALGWEALGLGDMNATVVAAVSLGNLSGKCTGNIKHPTKPNSTIPNGIPNMAEPGVILPKEVEHITILGDGDSDPAKTRMHLLAAARRFSGQGRTVSIAMAPAGKDWNDVAIEQAREARAA